MLIKQMWFSLRKVLKRALFYILKNNNLQQLDATTPVIKEKYTIPAAIWV
jgi:hypothetical protein